MSGNSIDSIGERIARRLASYTSRRSLLARLGTVLVAAPALPLLPVARALEPAGKATDPQAKTDFLHNAQTKDDKVCTYWRYCSIDGMLCTCMGGGIHTCPPGAQPSPTSWVGTCVNPDDGKSYLIAYRDCCGKRGSEVSKDCSCRATDRGLPIYRPQANSDILWCFGAGSSMTYHCTTAALVGSAT